MASDSSVEWTNHLPEMAEAIHKAAKEAVKKAAFDIEAKAKGNAPVDTGFLRSALYTVTSDSSDYGQASGGGKGATLLPEVEKPATETEATVAAGADYSVYVEYGTSKMTAQPFLTPAAEAVRPSFSAAMSAIEDKLKRLGIK